MIYKNILFIGFLFSISTVFCQDLTIYKSKQSVEMTADALVNMIKDNGLVFQDTISYQKVVVELGVEIQPTKIIMFEDPELTRQLIMCQQTTALDLPLKILVWKENEDVYIGFIDPMDMRKRFMLSGCNDTIDQLSRLMIRLVTDVMRAM